MNIIEFNAYVDKLQHHDWSHGFSDDIRAWRNGVESKKQLQAIAATCSQAREAYDAHSDFCSDRDSTWADKKKTLIVLLDDLRQEIHAAVSA